MSTLSGEAIQTRAPARSATTMRAAVLAGPRVIEVHELPLPEPGPGQVRVRLEGCGVCASNIPPWEGRPWFNYPWQPGAPGHEGWGTVDRVGAGVASLTEGQRVAMLSDHAYAEYDVAQASAVVVLPETLAGMPVPGEPLGCAMNVFRRARIRAGHTVAVVGVGFLGALVVQLAVGVGARVIALSRRPWACELARRFGAEETLAGEDRHQLAAQIMELTGGEGCDRVIEVTGKQGPLDLAGEITRIRGRLVIAGYHQDGLRQVNVQQWNWKGLDVINAHERDPALYVRGIRQAIAALEVGRIDPASLYTHRYRLEHLADALTAAADRPDGFLKALVMMDASD